MASDHSADQVAQPQQLRDNVIFGEQQPSRVQVTKTGVVYPWMNHPQMAV